MKLVRNILAVTAVVVGLASCEKVINVDLKNAEPKLVIEGTVDDAGNPATVILSKSAVFSANGNYPKVSGAVVTIKDNAGNSYNLPETSAGKYTNASVLGVVGRTYTLEVKLNGVTYKASSTIPRKMSLDTIVVSTGIATGTSSSAADKVAGVVYEDLPGFGDNSQIIVTINGTRDRNLYVSDDIFTDGGSSPFYTFNPNLKIKTGDTYSAELRFIDKNVYRYFYGVQDLLSGNTVPANPTTNLTGGDALGYFSAHTSEKKTIIVP
jgi:Domain of unknown function (DUF4249)